mmetsp:Transcript_27958/g.42625  ORF Transcript_27958/g.42625 Transcript_27958/m.42625 type:complete len:2205 (-) Transcript_27958:1535-8149(-)
MSTITDSSILSEVIDSLDAKELEERRSRINDRIETIKLPEVKKQKAPIESRSDTHWDFVLKEMMWLAADFRAERKRQHVLAKKTANGIHQFFKTKETRRLRQLADAELKRRRLAAKCGRNVRAWWTKIERVISYKQKLASDQERQKAMNQQLVDLVRLTERYGEKTTQSTSSGSDNVIVTIEQALTTANRLRTKSHNRDYSTVKLEAEELYGHSTTEESGSDGSFVLDSHSEDDETTLQQAEAEEARERQQLNTSSNYVSNQIEMNKLKEESTMDIDDVLQRLREERTTKGSQLVEVLEEHDDEVFPSKRVRFANSIEVTQISNADSQPMEMISAHQREDASHDADDDADASDVEDFVEIESGDDDGSAEYEVDECEEDDETTIAAEEKLGRDMEVEDEINLLQKEGEMPIEELRKLYALSSTSQKELNDIHAEKTDFRPKGTSQRSNDSTTRETGDIDDDSSLDEFEIETMEIDDETTIEAEEKLGREMSAEQEIDILQKEGEMPIEELQKLYGLISNPPGQYENRSVSSLIRSSSKEDEIQIREGDEQNASNSELHAAITDNGPVSTRTKGSRQDRMIDTEDQIKCLNETKEEDCMSSENDDADAASKANLNPFEHDDAEDEYKPLSVELDDETTIEAEECLPPELEPDQEFAILQEESKVPIEELQAMYVRMNQNEDDNKAGNDNIDANNTRNAITQKERDSDSIDELNHDMEDNDEFVPDAMVEIDDETTIEAEERRGREMSYEDEIALLKSESEMSIEELRKLYLEGKVPAEKQSIDNEGGNEEGKSEELSAVEDVEQKNLHSDIDAEDKKIQLKRKIISHGDELQASIGNDDSSIISTGDNSRKRQRAEGRDDGIKAIDALYVSEELARNTVATRPFLISNWVKLREYQQTGLNWLVSIQTRRLNGILADEMGLGKTLQTIALLAYLAAYKGIWGPHIVIVPTSVIINWETELKRFCPSLKVLCYYGSAKRRKELRTGWTKANWYHVIVTSYQLAVQDAFAFKRKKWYYMILDEAHNIKNFQSQRWQTLISFNSQRRLLLTGTPLQNNLTELWSLLHFLMPHVFRSRKEFSYWFSNPMNNIIEGNSKRSEDLISRLHAIIRPFVLRRLKKDVATQLPGKFEHVVKCQMSRRQMFLYEEFMARSLTRNALKKGGNFMGMMNVLMQLRKVCNHPDLFEPRAVVTPFAMEDLKYSVPRLFFDCTNEVNSIETTSSEFMRLPLWCGDSGIFLPSRSLQYDELIVQQTSVIKTPQIFFSDGISNGESFDGLLSKSRIGDGLRKHAYKIKTKEEKEKQELRNFQSSINEWRCRSLQFPYPNRLLRAVTLNDFPLDQEHADVVVDKEIISTPQHLLFLRRSVQSRADELDESIKRFVFCVPKAGGARITIDADTKKEHITKNYNKMLLEPLEEYLRPYQQAQARLSSFFPDKRLVQFDAGKLQTLAAVLHELKRGGHRALIFTQMSKMLDVLEIFLNLNGHTYLRLDGSTGVEKRQRLMDKFNNDDKVFCFILSTRSGGLGINLTGADSVIFYDTDWNPAMDAQAQDRAHRIGQTRDVHIYRLITEHSIEENIWTKAKQKRNLDLIVMDEGKFDASDGAEVHNDGNNSEGLRDMYSKGGLFEILRVNGDNNENESTPADGGPNKGQVTAVQLEKAMASLEDQDDVAAMQSARKEAEDELKEFDETIDIGNEDADTAKEDCEVNTKGGKERLAAKLSDDNARDTEEKKKESKSEEKEMLDEFNAWQSKLGIHASAIEKSLTPTERYGLSFRENIDPFLSVFAIMEERRRLEAKDDIDDDVDIEFLEQENANAEILALEEGDLLGTNPRPEDLPRQRYVYQRETARLRADKKRRKLTGENWVEKIDGRTKQAFWYNEDTGEARWEKPQVLVEIEADRTAITKRWNGLPKKPLVLVMSFLIHYPERTNSSLVCRKWRDAAMDVSFVLHVLPVEIPANHSSRKIAYHFGSISEALQAAQPGDSLEFGDGHYWVDNPGIEINFPLKFVGDEHDPSHVVIELSGSIRWRSKAGFFEGITFRRPKISSGEGATQGVLVVEPSCKIEMIHCVLNNEGSSGNVAVIRGARCRFFDVVFTGSQDNNGLLVEEESRLQLDQCKVQYNKCCAILCTQRSHITISNSLIENNGGFGLSLKQNSKGEVTKSRFAYNNGGILQREQGSTCVPCSANIALTTAPHAHRGIPGFRIISESKV